MGRGKFIWGVVLLILGVIMIIVGIGTTADPGSALINSNNTNSSFWYVLIPGMAVAVGGASLVIYEAFHHTES